MAAGTEGLTAMPGGLTGLFAEGEAFRVKSGRWQCETRSEWSAARFTEGNGLAVPQPFLAKARLAFCLETQAARKGVSRQVTMEAAAIWAAATPAKPVFRA